METTILLDKYKLYWKESNENVIVAQIRHFVKNEFGGSIETPIGMLMCYQETSPKFWCVDLVLRNEIKYNHLKNNIFVFTKSQYRFKINYYIDLVKSLFSKPNKIDKKFEEEIQVFLLSKNFIIEPYLFSVQIQKQETFQFIGEIDENDFD
ncbi:hypothetical protein D3C87_922370 [compost metagenome]